MHDRRFATGFGIGAAIAIVLAAIAFLAFEAGRSSHAEAAPPSEDSSMSSIANLYDSEATRAGQVRGVETTASDASYSQDEAEDISVYERYNESVVNITTEIVAVNWFMEPVPQSGGSGSGSIIDQRGYVLTNQHVVEGAYKLFVSLADGSRYPAELVGADKRNDLAVIKFDPPASVKLKPISFSSSKRLKVGQKVLAIGNPFGLERTLTKGIVSGLGRPIKKDDTTVLQNMIQTDASINPGNSGGPLFNARGEMVGINTMIYTPSGGSVGIGFAIPVDTAVRIVPELISQGRVRRGWIDIEAIQLFPALVDYLKQAGYGAPVEQGLLVSAVASGSPADKAGLRGGTTQVRYGRSTFRVGGDIIVRVDGAQVSTIADLYSALEDNKPG
ncbi:MAG TPA: trypsin-like peptidase domain-containing protein, partial [Rectinemataceae bacterium]